MGPRSNELQRILVLWLALLATANVFAEDAGPALQRIAFGSCNREFRPQVLWPSINECHPDLWIWLGDIVYGRADDQPDLARRYRIEKDQPGYKALRQKSRVIGVWDDNDFGISDGGKENSHKEQSKKLLLDFLDEPPGSPRRQQEGVYASYVFGPPGRRVKIILLDGRYFRQAAGVKADPLGAAQWQWLEQQLSESDADVNLIGSGIQVIASEHPFDKWADFPQARQRLFDVIGRSKARNVIILSGDRHLAEISRLEDPRLSQPLYDITSSGMTHHATNSIFHNFSREKNRYRRGSNFVNLNFGLLVFDWEASPASVSLQIHDASNAVRIEEKIPLAAGTVGR